VRYPKAIKHGSAVVKVYRVKHKTAAAGFVYSVAYVTSGARKVQQFTVEAEAIEEARLRAAQIASGRGDAASIGKPDRDELMVVRQLAGKVPLLAAMKEWRKAHDVSGGHIIAAAEAWAARNVKGITPKTVGVVVAEFLRAKTKLGKQVATDHGSIFDAIKADLGASLISAVTTAQLDRWLSKREHPVTRNTYRKRIVSVWRWAQRKGYLPRDARTEAEMTERAHEAAPVVGIISAGTFQGLLHFFRKKHPEYLSSLVIAGFAGLRRGEIHAQQWADINLEQKHLRVTVGKRGTPARRLVPLCDAAVAWLMLVPNRTDSICANLSMDRIRHIAREAKNAECEPLFPDIPDNAFRHSYISHKLASTGDIARVSLDAGNSAKEIQRHYRELVTQAEGTAWFSISP
jgi:integrase